MAKHNWHNSDNTQCVVVYHTYQHAQSPTSPPPLAPVAPQPSMLRYTNKSANDGSEEYIRTGHSTGQGSTTTTRTHVTQFINRLLSKALLPCYCPDTSSIAARRFAHDHSPCLATPILSSGLTGTLGDTSLRHLPGVGITKTHRSSNQASHGVTTQELAGPRTGASALPQSRIPEQRALFRRRHL